MVFYYVEFYLDMNRYRYLIMHSLDVHLKLFHSEKQDEPRENTKFQWQPMGFWSYNFWDNPSWVLTLSIYDGHNVARHICGQWHQRLQTDDRNPISESKELGHCSRIPLMKPNMEDKERGEEDDSPSEHDQFLAPCFVAHYYSRTFIELPLS